MTEQIEKQPLLIIAGATAVGKTDLSVALAKEIGGQIISADSMQVYKGMDIGTAKIRPEEMQGVPHYLIDELDPREKFNVFTFQSLAKRYMKEIYAKGKVPVLVGGTGFYIQSVLYDIAFSEEGGDKSYRALLEETARKQGPEALYEQLKAVDQKAAAEIHPNNVKRVIRALEFYHETGTLISSHNEEQRKRKSPYRFCYLVLNRKRAEIYDRINRRVDLMISEGLVQEVEGLLNAGVPKEAMSMQGLGYKEITSYLTGQASLEEAVDTLKKNTRHFAKRQITWFKREQDAVWINYEDYPNRETMLKAVTELVRKTLLSA